MTASSNDLDLRIHRQEQVDFSIIHVYEKQSDSIRNRISTVRVDDHENLEKRAELIEALYEKSEVPIKRMARSHQSTSTIVSLAAEGKPILAAYLYSFRGWDEKRIATEMGVSSSTIEQYLSDIINNHR
jgi:DNA-binding NarL/FixJ family response regulator